MQKKSSSSYLGAVVVIGALAGVLIAHGQSSVPTNIDELQSALKRLEAEVRTLKGTIEQLARNARSGRYTVAPPQSAAVAPSPAAPRKQVAPSSFRQAQESYNEGKRLEDLKLYRAAVEAYSDAIELDPKNDSAFLHRGYAYHQLGEYSSAVADFDRSLKLQSDNSRAFLARAMAYAAMGQAGPAMADVNDAILRDASNPDSYLLRGSFFQQQGESQRAIDDYTVAVSLLPNSERGYLGRAAMFLRDGLPERALEDCDRSVKVNPNSFSGYLCRAEAYIQMKTPERAIAELNRASETAQNLDQPVAFLNDTWQSFQAVNALNRPVITPAPAPANLVPVNATPTKPSTPAPKVVPTPGVAPGLPREAPAVVATVSAKAENASYYDKLGRKHTSVDNFTEALKALDKAIALDPRHASSYNARGFTHLLLRQYDQAIADFTEAIRLNPLYANAFHNRAVARRRIGDREAALEDDQKAAEYTVNGKQAADRSATARR